MTASSSLAGVSVRRPVTVLMGCVAVLLLGAVSFSELAVDLLPDVGTPRITLLTTAETLALAPQEIERLITTPLENAVQTVSGVQQITSTSREGTSVITVEFPWGTNLDLASLHVREAVDKVRALLPQGVERPAVLRWDPGSEPITGLAITRDGSLGTLRDLVEAVVVPRMEQVSGIAGAQVTGGAQREIQVSLDPDTLALYGLTVSDIERALAAANSSLQSGNVLQGLLRYQVRALGEFRNLDEIADLVVSVGAGGGRIRLRDLGTVRQGVRPTLAGALLDGREAVGVLLYKEAGSNTVEAVAAAREALAELSAQYPELTIVVAFENASFIEQAIQSVVQNMGWGSLFAFLVLFLFLRDPRNPLLIGLSIPISIITTFVLCYFADISLNIMTLGGLALGAGMLVDNSIVVLENIFRHRQLGASAAEAAQRGADEVAMPVTAATLTTIAVFLPVVYVHGVAGELFAPQAWTVTFALLASLLVSLTVLPMLASRFLHAGDPAASGVEDPALREHAEAPTAIGALRRSSARVRAGASRALDWLLATLLFLVHRTGRLVAWIVSPLLDAFAAAYEVFARAYHALLVAALSHKLVTLALVGILFAWGARTATILPWELMPRVQTGRFEVVVDTPPGTPFDRLEDIVRGLDEAGRAGPEVESTFATLGADPGAVAASALSAQSLSPTRARLSMVLAPGHTGDASAERAMARVRAAATGLRDVEVVVDPQSSPLQRLLGFEGSGFQVLVRGDDLAQLLAQAQATAAALAGVAGLEDVKAGIERGNPEIRLRVHRDVAAAYGVSVQQVAWALQSSLQGRVPTQFVEFDRRVDIRVLALSEEGNLEAMLDQPYQTARGPIPLRELVEVTSATGPVEIRHRDRVREIAVTATLAGISLSDAVERSTPMIEAMNWPVGTRWQIGGEREQVQDSFRSLAWALALAAALVYMVMAAQFESLLHPFVILFTLPLGWVGVIGGLWAAGLTVNVIALIGAVVLTGIVVNDGIVKIDTIARMQRGGMPMRRAVLEGSAMRLRPILMTTVTTVCALIPLALGFGSGAELQQPLAVAIIGGETTGTLLTLVVLPVVYELVSRRRG